MLKKLYNREAGGGIYRLSNPRTFNIAARSQNPMMKIRLLFPLLLLVCVVTPALGQTENPVSADSLAHAATASASVLTGATGALSVKAINNHLDEAKQLLKSRAADGVRPPLDSVMLATLDASDGRIDFLSLSKDFFLKRGAETLTSTSEGKIVRVRVVRANGVNTAVVVSDAASNRQLVPLVVQYPILRDGELREFAYYTSAHPALLSPEVVATGGAYVRTMLDEAAARLRSQGITIDPEIVDIAEHLCIVEHTDHGRFLREDRAVLFNEILSLYALNEPNTYRYSVSSAGAGGMVQMIPSTYQMVRGLYPSVDLKSDFVNGMTDHSNALTAMLLYMQGTWNDLLRSPEVRDALSTGIATQPELVAAGYNSNPARLPSYLRRGGADWRSLIPAETQMYLAIYGALDYLHFHNRPAPARKHEQNSSAMTPMLAMLLKFWNGEPDAPRTSLIAGLLPTFGKAFLSGGGLPSFNLR